MAGKAKLEWLEFGRGIAAIAVLFSHAGYVGTPEYLIAHVFDLGGWAVAFFFVLSGFIIFYVHDKDLGKPARAKNFAWRRFVRIFPTYWLVLIVGLVLRQYVGSQDFRIEITAPFLVKQFLLLPGGRLYLSVAWTLRHELLFYTVFFTAVVNFRVGVVIFCTWLSLIFFGLFTEGIKDDVTRPAWDTLTSHLNLYFFFGMAIAAAVRRDLLGTAAVGSVSITALAFIGWYFSESTLPVLQLFACASLVCGAALLSIEGFVAPPLSLWLGAISYPLYLFHLLGFQIAQGILKRVPQIHPTWGWKLGLSVFITLFVSVLLSQYYEKRLFRIIKGPKVSLSTSDQAR